MKKTAKMNKYLKKITNRMIWMIGDITLAAKWLAGYRILVFPIGG